MIFVATIGTPKLIPKYIADKLDAVVLTRLVCSYYYLFALVLLLGFAALVGCIVRLVLVVGAAPLIGLFCWHQHTSMRRTRR